MTGVAMPLVKHCVSRGCGGYPCYGRGSALAGVIAWACAAHRELIGLSRTPGRVASDARPVAEEAGPPSRPSAPVSPKQGSLFG